MDPKIAKKTQDSLGKIIKKPPLTEKLLGKPPFRFLHDIMTSVIKTTGFMKGLFTDTEMNSDNVKDRDAKTAFLQKAIDLVSVATGKSMSARPAKIVAGHEPEKTNEFLQALAAAINAKVDNEECVNKVLNEGSSGKSEEKKTRERDSSADKRQRDEEKKSRDKGRDESREKSRDRERGKEKSDKDREKEDRHKDREERHKDKEDRQKDKDREERHRDRDREREGRHKSGRSRQAPEGLDADFKDYDNLGRAGTSDIPNEDMLGSDDEFITPYNTPVENFDATYAVHKIPQEFADDENMDSGLEYNVPKVDLDERDIEEMEELRRRQGSRTSRANRPKAARPRRGLQAKDEESMRQPETVDQMIVDREEGSGSDDSELEKVNILKKRKSGTKSRLSNRKKAELEESLDKSPDKMVEPAQQPVMRRDSFKGPRTSTPKNSPEGMIPVKESRMNLKRSPPQPLVDRRRASKPKVLSSPTKITSGSRRLSLKDQVVDPSPGQSPEKQDSAKGKDRTVEGRDRKLSGTSKTKAKDKLRGPYARDAREIDISPKKPGKSVVSQKPRAVPQTEPDRYDSDVLKQEITPKSRKSRLRQTDSDTDHIADKNKKGHISGKDVADQYNVIQKTANIKEKRRTSSFTMMSKKQRREEDGKENDAPGNEMVNGEKEPKDAAPPRLQRPSSAKGSRRRMEDAPPARQEPAMGEDDLPPQVAAGRLARPSSARPAPPKRKEDTIQNEPAMRLGSGKPQNLIIDDGKESDEDETFVVEEPAAPPIDQEQSMMKPRTEEDDDDEDHGGLVKKIMETKKEYEQTRKTEIERPTVSDAQRRKQREAVQREIDKLRTSIQTLTRSANPLGKIMDYVQEDLDSMQKELEKWKAENKEHALALKREKAITERAVEPLKVQLGEVDQAIKDQLDLIGAVKSNIIRNDMKIEKMLRTIAKS